MDRWDILILAVAVYVAVMTLTRMMAGRRNALVDEARKQIAQELKNQRKPSQDPGDRGAA